MTYQLCAPETVSAEPKAGDALASLRERMEHARTLGLTAQAAFLERELRHGEKQPKELKPLSADEVTVWKRWLPTCYRDDQHWHDNGSTMRKLSSYMFDRVPSPVLKLWTALKEQGVFDYYEIWTPEKRKTDPVLIGVLGNERYLLARWGESDANFLNFEDVAKTLWKRRSESGWSVDMEGVYIATFLGHLAVIGPAVATALLVWYAVLGLGRIDGGGFAFIGFFLTLFSSIGATWLRMRGPKGEQAYIKMLFAMDPEGEWQFNSTEHLRAICRIHGKAPESK